MRTKARALARSTDPKTSHEAAEYMVSSGSLGGAQKRALLAVASHSGLTATELAKRVGDSDPRKINRRLNELEKGGSLVREAVRKCKVTGRNAATWRVGNGTPQPKAPRITTSITARAALLAAGKIPRTAKAGLRGALIDAGKKIRDGAEEVRIVITVKRKGRA